MTRHIATEVCPWHVMFARVLRAESPCAAPSLLAGKDEATLARDLPALAEETFRAAFRGAPRKRA